MELVSKTISVGVKKLKCEYTSDMINDIKSLKPFDPYKTLNNRIKADKRIESINNLFKT